MTPVETKLIEAWRDFKVYAQTEMGYTNSENVNECVNGAAAFIDFLRGGKPRAGKKYATSAKWPTA